MQGGNPLTYMRCRGEIGMVKVCMTTNGSNITSILTKVEKIMKTPYVSGVQGGMYATSQPITEDVLSDLDKAYKAIGYLTKQGYLVNSLDANVAYPCNKCCNSIEVLALQSRLYANNSEYSKYSEALDIIDYIDHSESKDYVTIEFIYGMEQYQLYI